MELAHLVSQYADTCPGLEQYAIKRFAAALEAFPKVLADNSGCKATEVLSRLYAAHQEGKKTAGFNVEVRPARPPSRSYYVHTAWYDVCSAEYDTIMFTECKGLLSKDCQKNV